MTETQENLKIAEANQKFWEYMTDEKDTILQEETQKLEDAKLNFLKMFQKLRSAPEKLSKTAENVKLLKIQVKKEREIPEKEIISLIDVMKMKLRKLGIAC